MIISIDAEKEFIKIQFPLISRIDIKGMYFNIIKATYKPKANIKINSEKNKKKVILLRSETREG